MDGDLYAPLRDWLARSGESVAVQHGTIVVEIAPERLRAVAGGLRTDFGFDLLLDVTAIDWPAREPRFDVVWHFYSTTHRARVRVKTRVPESSPDVDSLSSSYASARFAERECHEMYGIGFRGNDDLRPLLLYEGFVGHPLRKDYPKDLAQPLVPYRK